MSRAKRSKRACSAAHSHATSKGGTSVAGSSASSERTGVSAVRSVLDDSANRLGRNARGYVCRNHTFDTIARQYATVYREALAE